MKYAPISAGRLVTPATFFRRFIRSVEFPCVGAKSALATRTLEVFTAWNLEREDADADIVAKLGRFARKIDGATALVSLAVLFPVTPQLSEKKFEESLWRRLQALHELDAKLHPWNPAVSKNPTDPNFGMSFGGEAFFVVGLHPGASRKARRAPFATMIFNAHKQFDKLREDGRYDTMRDIIRDRDTALEGDINPMLSNHGEMSEAPQYSGRRVGGDWACPFHAKAS